jgi:large subunit ribosomal protein L25
MTMAKFELSAEVRDVKGKGASRRLRRDGKVPAVMYGAGKDAVSLTLDHNALYLQVKNEAFYSSILTVNISGQGQEQAVLRDLQMHPYKPRIAHLDLQRISATEKIHMKVPLHFINQDIAPGVKQQGGIVAHLMNEVEVTCLPKDLPEFFAIDMGNIALNQSVHLSDIKLPAGVEILQLVRGGDDLAVATITAVREEVEVAPVVEAAPAEGAAAPAAEAGKAEAAKPEAGKAEPAKKEGGKK